jgi:hypothetical protein
MNLKGVRQSISGVFLQVGRQPFGPFSPTVILNLFEEKK